ncbi:cytochrome oxidase maturation protein, cbb3-type [Methylophilus rhizosphaerae]|uniref:Cytochrome oxidase maturation protein, cbb3-type n=1 Tax=Methylophilus rhizosphaerae TaxID=492660 RepID=A0A1G9B8T0_9PROT|nr:cbb3-type cytochrome oxidase assembly protein CcoS [Methylophilus rhizosphaerae]SDK35883.1 cytochrome oxidase maturation protein, cbb3-type [Methylophilus rhizosphaerae]
MEIAFLLIPMAVILVFAILGGLWWAIQTGQFEDLEEEGSRILEQD